MLTPGALIHNRYEIIRHIGKGGMGAVYEATDTRLNSTVALKQTIIDGEQVDKAFKREAQLLAQLRHPNLPRVMDYFVLENEHFLVMEFFSGKDLKQLLKERQEPFSVDEVLEWADQLLVTLNYLHTQEPPVIHRDISPKNLKLTPSNEIILLDFGLAKGLVSQISTPQSVFAFTLQYAPLEQVQGTGTEPRSDLFSLAATVYHLLTGSAPVNAPARADKVMHWHPDPLPAIHTKNPHVPPEIGSVIMRGLSLKVEDRPASAAEMRIALKTAFQSSAHTTHPSVHHTAQRKQQGFPWLWIVIGIACIVVVVFFFMR